MNNPNGHIDDYPDDEDDLIVPDDYDDEPGTFYQYAYDTLPDDDTCPGCGQPLFDIPCFDCDRCDACCMCD